MYNDVEKKTNNMNEIFRSFMKTEYDKGWYDTTMSHYNKGYLPKEVAAEELSMNTEQFLEAYEEWFESKPRLTLSD